MISAFGGGMFEGVKFAESEGWVWGLACVWGGLARACTSGVGDGPTRTRKPPLPGLETRCQGSGGYGMPKEVDGRRAAGLC